MATLKLKDLLKETIDDAEVKELETEWSWLGNTLSVLYISSMIS